MALEAETLNLRLNELLGLQDISKEWVPKSPRNQTLPFEASRPVLQ
jgi:hypothetical protein